MAHRLVSSRRVPESIFSAQVFKYLSKFHLCPLFGLSWRTLFECPEDGQTLMLYRERASCVYREHYSPSLFIDRTATSLISLIARVSSTRIARSSAAKRRPKVRGYSRIVVASSRSESTDSPDELKILLVDVKFSNLLFSSLLSSLLFSSLHFTLFSHFFSFSRFLDLSL